MTMRNRQLRASVKAALWTHYSYVESDSEPGTTHEIKQHEDGRLGCDCLSYRFSPGTAKTCKHIIALGMPVTRTLTFAAPGGGKLDRLKTERVDYRGETFTVRRAISFGRIGA